MFCRHKLCRTVGKGVALFDSFDILGIFFGTDVAVNGVVIIIFANAYKVHKVIAVIGSDDLNIALFACRVEAPIFKFLDHLTLLDILVQSAVGFGAGIFAVCKGKVAEVVLGFAKRFIGCLLYTSDAADDDYTV